MSYRTLLHRKRKPRLLPCRGSSQRRWLGGNQPHARSLLAQCDRTMLGPILKLWVRPRSPPLSRTRRFFDPVVKAGGELRLRQAAANLELTLFAALAMSAATASGFET